MTNKISLRVGAVSAALFLTQTLASAAVTVLTVPWVPATPTTPHTTYPVNSTTEATIILVATVPSAVGSTDAFTYQWNFGDGTSSTAAAVTNPYDLSVTHQYPASAATGTQWTATITVTDTTTSTTGSAKYYVIQEPNNLSSRVNVAIDWGLSYMHRTMWRNGTNPNAATAGGWDTQNYNCNAVNSSTFDCQYWGSLDAENVQAFEVNGHLASGPATDPYTDDVTRGLARVFTQLTTMTNSTDTFNYNPAVQSFTCQDGSVPTTADPTCTGHGGQYFYNSAATSCTSPPCTFTFDGNKNGQMIYSNDGSGEPIYTSSPFVDALIAAGTPSATAPTGPAGIVGQTYQNIIQDILDYYAYSEYGSDCDVYNGNTRGNGGSCAGGAWLYDPQEGDDGSTSQWAAIGMISGQRGAGIPIPPIVTDANNVWITNAQDVTDPKPTGADPLSAGDNYGAYGYRGSFAYSNAWGPFAVTPSGMVQMAMDGVGRTSNTALGGSTNAPDQRWNNTETFYADNFCNSVVPYSQAQYAPRAYMYGLFSFTKGMLLHDPSGLLSPIQYMQTQTPKVFTTNSKIPANTIDWYAAQSAATLAAAPDNTVGTDPCDGVAQTLVNYQLNPTYGVVDGHWYGQDYDGNQYYYETAWALIMLKRTVFVTCINDLTGAGAATGAQPARIDLSWSNQANSTKYTVLRSTTSGSGYVAIGTTSNTSFSDPLNDSIPLPPALVNGKTYY
jgi:hypothetical protein